MIINAEFNQCFAKNEEKLEETERKRAIECERIERENTDEKEWGSREALIAWHRLCECKLDSLEHMYLKRKKNIIIDDTGMRVEATAKIKTNFV